MTKQIAVLQGDGIGPEIIGQAVKVLDKLIEQGLDARYEYGLLGGSAYDAHGSPYPEATQTLCRKADAVLLGAVGGPQYDNLERSVRPERGLLAIRKDLNLFANLRPAKVFDALVDSINIIQWDEFSQEEKNEFEKVLKSTSHVNCVIRNLVWNFECSILSNNLKVYIVKS